MPIKSVLYGAVTGSTLIALSLAGSCWNPANLPKLVDKTSLAEVKRLHGLGKVAFSEGRYLEARDAFSAAARRAATQHSSYDEAMDWSNAGFAAVSAMQYGPALTDLSRARSVAESSGELVPLIFAFNNLTSLYLQMGAPENALRISREALMGAAGHANPGIRAKLLYQQAQAMATLGRFPEAEPIFRESLTQLMDAGDLDGAARGWAGLGGYYFDALRYPDAERALSESLRLVRTHRLKAATRVLANLAKLRGKQGNYQAAENLFRAALDTRESMTPRWIVYAERGRFRLENGRTELALQDFREARLLAIRMRADIVPADQDRIALENRVSRVFEGLVDAGNSLALSTGQNSLLAETFDAAEQDRLWSLRALVPEPNDWRSRLPARYWELLVRLQALQRASAAGTPGTETQIADLEMELQLAEAAAGGPAGVARPAELPSIHVMKILDPESALFSFLFTESGSWLWVVDRAEIRVYPLPARDQIQHEVADFNSALRHGEDSKPSGEKLFTSLFGKVPARTLAHRRWLIEPDGPLYDLPFAALPVAGRQGSPGFLIERAALQNIPGALLFGEGAIHTDGSFTGIADAVYNRADFRLRWKADRNPGPALPRLPNTARETEACSRAWGSSSSRILIGPDASPDLVASALAASPAVIHFATHIVSVPDTLGSGLIVLSPGANGAAGFMGPTDITARRVAGSLVVMNGCHSAQGSALPGSGLMGLTRAWIGAGAYAVVSTRWDVPDEAAQSLMVDFYRSLHGASRGKPAEALRDAQLTALRSAGPASQPSHWAGYVLLSRI